MEVEWPLPRTAFAVHSLQQEINICAMSSKSVQKDWQLLFICYGNQCLPGDESAANTPLLISQFLPCTPQTGDRERPELLSVKSSTVTTDRPSSPRQLTPSEVCLTDAIHFITCLTHQTCPANSLVESQLWVVLLSLYRWRMRPAHHPGPSLATQARSAFALPATGEWGVWN